MSPRPLLTGADVSELFTSVLPDEALARFVEETRFQERNRKLEARKFLRATVFAAAAGSGGRQSKIMEFYFDSGAWRVVRGGFYAWFNERFEDTMHLVVRHALEYVRRQPLDLPPVMARYARDWHIYDSSTIKLADRLKLEYPGTGDYAALKVHKRFSVGIGTMVDFHLSPAREHDGPHLVIDDTWRGLGLLADLGYASLQLIADCATYEVRFIIRLKQSWKPRVERVRRGEVNGTFFAGTDLDALLDTEVLVLDGRVIDADVTIGPPGRSVRCRLVGVPAPDGAYRFYLTNLPASAGPLQVSDFYRVRWEIESDNKLDKSCNHIDEARAETGQATRALIYASLTSSMLACLLSHRHRLKTKPPSTRSVERKDPPLHPQSVARAMATAAARMAAAFELRGKEADAAWQSIAEYLEHLGRDPNWRRSPSILDQLRGWKISPGRPRRARLASPTRERAN
jgi:hypothetical protein